MRTNNKKGISLLVLVITILVMVILAGAIILQIRNSKITEKAEKAKVSSDNANLKEYIELVKADWEMMTKKEQKATGCKTRAAYINKMLEQEGYINVTVGTDGTIYTDLSEITKDAISQGIKIGDRVNYVVTSKTETSYATGNGNGDKIISNYTDFIWRYIGMNENGELLIAPDMTSEAPSIMLRGYEGWLNGPDELNRLCKELYTVSGKGTARSMNIDDITRLLGYTGEKGAYYDTNGTYTPTAEARKISDIAKELGKYTDYSVLYNGLIMEKKIGEYLSDYYIIDKENDVSKMKSLENIQYVYYGTSSTDCSYWLSSACCYTQFKYNVPYFYWSLLSVSNKRVAYLEDLGPGLVFGPRT